MVKSSTNELRCFCSRLPLLATYEVGDDRKVYVHIKIFKQRRIYGEILVSEGTVKLRCRDCLRWHKVTISKSRLVTLQEDSISSIELQCFPTLDA